ncbi:MAG: hypothetical protein ACK5O7_00375 [Holosporales bacterium]
MKEMLYLFKALTPTLVSFHLGTTVQEAKVVGYLSTNRPAPAAYLIVDQTPFHPVDPHWQDQPGDRGTIAWSTKTWQIEDTHVIGVDLQQQWFVHTDVKQSWQDPNMTYLVGHKLTSSAELSEAELEALKGQTVTLSIDEAYRASVERPHSAVHLSSLLFNELVQPYIGKADKLRKDARGYADFDKDCIVTSTLQDYQSIDTYRMGNSYRKKAGLNQVKLREDLPGIIVSLNERLAAFIRSAGQATMSPDYPVALHERRFWKTEIDQKPISIPCGGTHLRDLSSLESVEVRLQFASDREDSFDLITNVNK